MSVDIKTEGLSEFSKELMDLANKKFPRIRRISFSVQEINSNLRQKKTIKKVLRKAQRTSLKD